MLDRQTITGPLGLSVAALVAIAIVLAIQLPPVLTALLGAGPAGDESEATLAEFIERFEAEQQTHLDRFNGRSVFFKPPPWPAPPRPAPKVVTAPEPERDPDPAPAPPPAPRAPTRYEGPDIIFALSSEVWFRGSDGPFAVAVGEEANGVGVVATDELPWRVTLSHRGWEGTVEVFATGATPDLVQLEADDKASSSDRDPTHPGIVVETEVAKVESTPAPDRREEE